MATDPHGAPIADPEAHQRRPVVWMVLTGLLALAVVGLAIWAFGAQSDADDAEAKLASQSQTTVQVQPTEPDSTTSAPATTESAPPTASTSTSEESAPPASNDVSPETQQRYEEIKTELGSSEAAGDIEQRLGAAREEADAAQQARDEASGAVDRVKAEAEAFKAQAKVTRTCLQGTLAALDAAFAGGGLEAVVAQLDTLKGGCRSAASA